MQRQVWTEREVTAQRLIARWLQTDEAYEWIERSGDLADFSDYDLVVLMKEQVESKHD